MSSVGHGEEGDNEATVRFRNAGTEEVDGVVDPVLRCTIRGDEEVAGVEVVPCVLLVRSEMLHGGVSATRSLCSLSGIFRRRRRGQRGEETMAARGRKERGGLGFGAAPRGWL